MRQVIFGEFARLKADVILELGLSDEGKMAAASPGPGFPKALEVIWDCVRPRVQERIADLGAGLGGASAWMAVRGARVVGFESEAGSVLGGRRLFPDLDLRQADVATAQLRGFSGVTLFGLLSLCPDPAQLLRHIACALAPDAAIVGSDTVREARGRQWIAVVDLVAASDHEVVTERNRFLPLGALIESLDPPWSCPLSETIVESELVSVWHHVNVGIETAVRERMRPETSMIFDADRRNLDELLRNDDVRAAVVVFHRSLPSVDTQLSGVRRD